MATIRVFMSVPSTYSDYMYVNDAAQAVSFSEVLLGDGTNLIYTAVVENNVAGFDNNPYDFQMIVAEDGDDSANVAYYFYVELGG